MPKQTNIKRKRFIKKPISPQKHYRMNHLIRTSPIHVIDEDGKNLGIMETSAALRIAEQKGLDLIEIAPTANPPVCKITDFGKFKYEQEKKSKLKQKGQKGGEVKRIRIGFTTSHHDLERIAKKAEEFLKGGNRVFIDMRLRGREKAFKDMALQKMNNFMQMITVEYIVEIPPKSSPQGLSTTIIKK